MNIKLKLFKGAKTPTYKTNGAACADCYANVQTVVDVGETRIIPLGFAIELPEGYEAQIRGRSGLASRKINIALGTVDADYRGEVGAIVTNNSKFPFNIFLGDRIAQMKIGVAPQYKFVEVEYLSDTDRGVGGFGSTGV